MKVKNGDLLKILMEDGDHMYGEKVGNIYESDEYEVYLINSDNNNVYTYNDYIDIIPRKSVLYHVRNNGDYESAWRQMKFSMLNNNGIISFSKIDDDTDNESIYVESIDSESDSDLGSQDTFSSNDDSDELSDDFIDDDVTFCPSTCECELCDSVKTNNQLYKSWTPKTLFEKRMKYTIDKLEIDAINELDNVQFSNP